MRDFIMGDAAKRTLIASRAGRSSEGGGCYICFGILLIMTIILTVLTASGGNIPWEVTVGLWTMVGVLLFVIILVNRDGDNEFDCQVCVYQNCDRRGRETRVFLCTSWDSNEGFYALIGGIVFTVTFTLIGLLSPDWGVRIFGWVFAVPGWLITIGSVYTHYSRNYKKRLPSPLYLVTPPPHADTCECEGSGICHGCGGTGWGTDQFGLGQRVSCTLCKGTTICPGEHPFPDPAPGTSFKTINKRFIMLVIRNEQLCRYCTIKLKHNAQTDRLHCARCGKSFRQTGPFFK